MDQIWIRPEQAPDLEMGLDPEQSRMGPSPDPDLTPELWQDLDLDLDPELGGFGAGS